MGRPRRAVTAHPNLATLPPLLTAKEWARVVDAFELSPQQGRIVELILEGKRDKQIAASLGLSKWTVRSHLTKTFVRLGVADRSELLIRVFRLDREVGGKGSQ